MFENALFIVPVSTSLILIATGYYMLKKPPKSINHFYGYRTKRSMKSQEAWDFSQKYAAKSMLRWGFYYLLTALLAFVIQPSILWEISISLSLMFVFIFIPIYKTERILIQKFGR
ncbi:MAG: SdpI family protein [Psychroflexus maritimus]